MTFNKALKEYKLETWETTNKKELEDDWGVQFAMRRGEYTFATSYFYRSQNSTMREFAQFKEWMLTRGFVVETTQTEPRFEMASWPKTSWARVTYTVDVVG